MTMGNCQVRSFHIILQKQQEESCSYRNYSLIHVAKLYGSKRKNEEKF